MLKKNKKDNPKQNNIDNDQKDLVFHEDYHKHILNHHRLKLNQYMNCTLQNYQHHINYSQVLNMTYNVHLESYVIHLDMYKHHYHQELYLNQYKQLVFYFVQPHNYYIQEQSMVNINHWG